MKYEPRKVYIKENGSYTELSYKEFCSCRETDRAYADKLFIPVQGGLRSPIHAARLTIHKVGVRNRPYFSDKLIEDWRWQKAYMDYMSEESL